MEVALVLVMAGLVAVSLAKDFMVWQQQKKMRRVLFLKATDTEAWQSDHSRQLFLVKSDLANFQFSQERATKDLRHDLVTVRLLPDAILARLTEALKNDVDSLKQMLSRGPAGQTDKLYQDAVKITYAENHVSGNLLRKRLGIGHKRAVKLLTRMVQENVVTQNGKPGNYLPIIQGEKP